jgi:hypothetical protein
MKVKTQFEGQDKISIREFYHIESQLINPISENADFSESILQLDGEYCQFIDYHKRQ